VINSIAALHARRRVQIPAWRLVILTDGFHSNEELHNLYSSPDIIRQIKSRRMRWAGDVARMGEERKVYKILVGKPEGKRPLGRPRRRWEDVITLSDKPS
jgi:hypothetical protein